MIERIKNITHSNYFAYIVTIVIVLNSILVGLELHLDNIYISALQDFCIAFFVIEIILRWIGKKSIKEYVKNGWNWFDIIIVIITIIPQDLFDNASMVSTFRVLRVFRVLRLFKNFPNIALMARVLFRSVISLSQAIFFLLIFMYLYALIGIILFQNKIYVSNINSEKIDPFGNISEAFFSLFRVATGEDWSDLRYDLMDTAGSNWVVNIYFISLIVISTFLLLNVIIGAVVNNYDIEYNEKREGEQTNKLNKILEKIDQLEKRLN